MDQERRNETQRPQVKWRSGGLLIMVAPLVGFLAILGEPPIWLQITVIVVMLALVFEGSRRTFWKPRGGWLPSKTLPKDDHSHGA